jgi:hypothetical protein
MSKNGLAKSNFFAPARSGQQSTDIGFLRQERDYGAEALEAQGYLLTLAETSITLAVNHGNFCIDAVPEAAEFVRGFRRVTAVGMAGSLQNFGRKINQ